MISRLTPSFLENEICIHKYFAFLSDGFMGLDMSPTTANIPCALECVFCWMMKDDEANHPREVCELRLWMTPFNSFTFLLTFCLLFLLIRPSRVLMSPSITVGLSSSLFGYKNVRFMELEPIVRCICI